jgi:hypothetical protein
MLKSPPAEAAREIRSYKKVMLNLAMDHFYRDCGIESLWNEERTRAEGILSLYVVRPTRVSTVSRGTRRCSLASRLVLTDEILTTRAETSLISSSDDEEDSVVNSC